jgi:hypothetical protein
MTDKSSTALAIVMAVSFLSPAWAQELPTDPIGGKPAAGSKPSVENLVDQVKYQRAFESVIWSMPAVIKYGMRRASIEIGAGDNVVMAWSAGATPALESVGAILAWDAPS